MLASYSAFRPLKYSDGNPIVVIRRLNFVTTPILTCGGVTWFRRVRRLKYSHSLSIGGVGVLASYITARIGFGKTTTPRSETIFDEKCKKNTYRAHINDDGRRCAVFETTCSPSNAKTTYTSEFTTNRFFSDKRITRLIDRLNRRKRTSSCSLVLN